MAEHYSAHAIITSTEETELAWWLFSLHAAHTTTADGTPATDAARLMLAAPDLLAALEAMLAPMDSMAAERFHPETAARIRIARAAVARATTAQP